MITDQFVILFFECRGMFGAFHDESKDPHRVRAEGVRRILCPSEQLIDSGLLQNKQCISLVSTLAASSPRSEVAFACQVETQGPTKPAGSLDLPQF